MNAPVRNIFSAALCLSLAATATLAQAGGPGGPQIYSSGLLHTPLGGAPLFQNNPGTREVSFIAFDNSLTQGVNIQCSSNGGAQCTVDMAPVLATAGARLKVWQLMQGQNGAQALSSMQVTSLAGGAAECTADFSALGATSMTITLRDRYGNALASQTCGTSSCACVITDGPGGGGTAGSHWEFSAHAKTGYDLKANVKCRMMSGDATVTGVGSTPVAHVASVEFSYIICITEPCPTSWPHMSAMQVTAGTGGAPVALPITVTNAGLHSFSWGVSNPRSTDTSGHTAGLRSGALYCWGSNDIQIGEVCDDGNTVCGDGLRVLRLTGLDSSSGRSAFVDFDAEELDASASRDSLTTLSDARRVSFQVVPDAAGIPFGTVRCGVMGRDSITGPMVLRYLFGLRGPAFTCSSISCAAGSTIPMCRVRCVDASGAVLATETVAEFDEVHFATAVPWPVITIEPTDQCVFDCSGAGAATCVMPSGAVVSGVARLVYSPLMSPMVGIGAARLSITADGFTQVRLKDVVTTNPLYLGGLPLVAKTATLVVTGTPGGSATATLSGIAPPSPTGEPVSGVELVYGTKNGVAFDVDLDTIFNTPGAAMKIKNRGWNGLPHGQHRITGAGGGHGQLTCDYSDTPGIGIHWVMRDSIGAVLAEGDVPGATLSCAIDTTCCGGPPPPGGAPQFTVSTSSKADYDLKLIKGGRTPLTITGLTPTPTTMVAQISFSRIVCITAPCPGDGTGTMAAMQIGVSGVPELKFASPELLVDKTPPSIPGVSSVRKEMLRSIRGRARALEVCTATCTSDTVALCLTDLGMNEISTDQVVFSEPVSSVSCSAKLDCDFVSSTGGGDDAPTESVSFYARPRAPAGNGQADALTDGLLMIRYVITPDPATEHCGVAFDGSGRGSSQCRVECLSSTGAVLASAMLDNGLAVQCYGAASGGDITYIGTCDATGMATISPFTVTGQCELPGGQVVSGVARLRALPVSPTAPAGPILGLTKDVKSAENSDTLVAFKFDIVRSGGLALSPLGAAVLTPTPAGVDATNLSCSGEDGVRVHLDTGNGGQVTIPVGALFAGAQPCGGPRIRIKHMAWDGSIAATTTLLRLPAGGGMTETYEVPGLPASGVLLVCYSVDGGTLFSSTIPGTTLTWGVTAEGNAATLEKCYTSVAMSDARQGFFDIAGKRTVTITGLGTAPITGVHAVHCMPIYMSGAELSPRLASLDVVGHSMASLGIHAPQRVRLAHGDNYPPPDRFAAFPGLGSALVDERCASIYPCPWDTQQIVVSNIGSSGNDGVRIRPTFTNGNLPDITDFAVAACGSWGETGGPGGMTASYLKKHELTGNVTLVKIDVVHDPFAPVFTENYFFSAAGRGSFTATLQILNAVGTVIRTVVVGPTTPITITYCNTDTMPTFGNQGGVAFLTLPAVGNACYTITVAGQTTASGRKLVFTPNSPTNNDAIHELAFTGAGLQDIVIGDVQLNFPPACPADLGIQGGTPGRDGLYNNNDFVVFINFFFSGDLRADLGIQGGSPGQDNLLNNNDFVVFIDHFFRGCPPAGP